MAPSRARIGAWDRPARLLANLLLLALVMYLAVWGARATWLMAWDEQLLFLATSEAESGGAKQRREGQSLAAYEFFGRDLAEVSVNEAVRRAAPATGLKLRLEGVLVAQQGGASGAIVAGSDEGTEYYRVGDTLPGNAKLVEVDAGRILIRRNGKIESLTFEEPVASELLAEETQVSGAGSPEELLDEARARLNAEGAAALAPYGLQPAEAAGVSGYMYDGSNAMLNAVNLRQGDIITAINGQPLGNIEQDIELLDSWRSQPQLEIEIERDGSRLTLSYAIPAQWR